MMRNILFILTLLFSLNLTGQGFTPTRDVEATDDGIIVTYHLNGGQEQADPLHPGAKFWKIPGFPLNDVAGQPAFPFHWDTFVIPDDCEVSVELIDSTYSDIPFTMAPAYPPLLMSDTIGYTPERVPNITNYSGWMPGSAVMKGDLLNYRGQGLVKVAVTPAQYRCNHTLRAFSMIQYKVSFMRNGARVRGRDYVSDSADSNISLTDYFLENTTLNYSLSWNGRQNVRRRNAGTRTENTAQLDNRGYLIITTDNFLDAVNEFAEWKRTKGFNVEVLSKPAVHWSPTLIKDTIAYRYAISKTTYPIYYLLIVGDKEYVPTESMATVQNHFSDYYYGHRTLRYDTLHIHQGRIPVKNNAEARTVFNKIIEYERNPSGDLHFYRNITIPSFFDDIFGYDSQHQPIRHNREHLNLVTLNEKIKLFLSPGYITNRIYKAENISNPLLWYDGDSIPFELRKPGFTWSGKSHDIISAINSGTFLLVYGGHGDVSDWSSFYFGQLHINHLQNSGKLPVIISRGCSTGNFTDSSPCIAEMFLRKESTGCVAMTAPTEESFSTTSGVMLVNMIDAIWPGFCSFAVNDTVGNMQNCTIPTFTLGDAFDYATYKILDSNPPLSLPEWNPYEIEIQHFFGDPSMMIYTARPTSVPQPNIIIRNDSVFVETTDGDARISFHAVGAFYKSSYIGNHAAFKMRNKDVVVCVDRHNYIPFVVKISSDGFIQNENINDNRVYNNSSTIKIGSNVTTTKASGDVVIDGANVTINAANVELHPGTTIVNSNVIINKKQ